MPCPTCPDQLSQTRSHLYCHIWNPPEPTRLLTGSSCQPESYALRGPKSICLENQTTGLDVRAEGAGSTVPESRPAGPVWEKGHRQLARQTSRQAVALRGATKTIFTAGPPALLWRRLIAMSRGRHRFPICRGERQVGATWHLTDQQRNNLVTTPSHGNRPDNPGLYALPGRLCHVRTPAYGQRFTTPPASISRFSSLPSCAILTWTWLSPSFDIYVPP